MSKLLEYLKLVPKGIVNAKQIVEAVVNNAKIELGTLPQHELDIIIGRRIICASCPYMSRNAVEAGIYMTDRNDDHCTMCSCPIITKTASLTSDCGIAEFNKDHPDTQIPLRWVAAK